ncbi:hypothetical protein [Sedimentibacter sp. MB31-C6]|uniref:hypothetical protein n=1 Tax=Sedimentibacter sp. MB31-C6 TaxID=3109366 RepID=UPI002DDCA010|nr:hypothetical protein [Sedimentibacter sp. MB36-C1]WSI04921.1 hypothetical protein U8307_03780 [Sedimentibacter sp. MB36-C1]
MRKSKILNVIILLLIVAFLFFGTNITKKSNEENKFVILEEAIIRGAIQCYAIEGFYPPNIEYLESNYGLIIDHEKYYVSYIAFASNIIPEIKVFLK